jgi:ribosomal protein S18 acetylase RimI-like enzyme
LNDKPFLLKEYNGESKSLSIVYDVRFEELRSELWCAVERLFGPNGACGGCWCMWWRAGRNMSWSEVKGAPAKSMFKGLVQNGKAHGILAFVEDEPVGWCSFGLRQDFSGLEKVRAYKRNDIGDVWSITCFFIHRKWRGKGLVRGLLRAAVVAMQRRGVKIIEAYPVTTTKDGRRLSTSLAWTGPLKIFEELGFKTVQSTNPLKPLMRLELKK